MVCVYENFPKIKPKIDFNYYFTNVQKFINV